MNGIKNIVVYRKHPNLKREVHIGLADASNPDIGHLSQLDPEDIREAIAELETLISENNPESYVEWGVDLCSVVSFPEVSRCSDTIQGLDLADISTPQLLSFIRQLDEFKDQYSNPALLKSSIAQAFQHIKSDPSRYRKWEDSTYYEITIDSILVLLNLSEHDLQLTPAEYTDQLETL